MSGNQKLEKIINFDVIEYCRLNRTNIVSYIDACIDANEYSFFSGDDLDEVYKQNDELLAYAKQYYNYIPRRED